MAIVNLKIHTREEGPGARYVAEVDLRGIMRQEDLVAKVQQMPGIVTAMRL